MDEAIEVDEGVELSESAAVAEGLKIKMVNFAA
jgi:hypothetical protein